MHSGRLELVNGGWTQHDEACTNYLDMLVNIQTGHEFMMKEFGVRPTTSWQIDPFGHSSTHAKLMSQLGYEFLVFARADYEFKD